MTGDTQDQRPTDAVTLRDHFCDFTTLRVAQPQPQYETVQLKGPTR